MKKYLVTSSLIAILLVIPSLSSATPTDRQIVASKAYVDTKQNIIPAGTYGANNSVITYDATSGTTQERWILGAGSTLPHDFMVALAGNALSGNNMNGLRNILLPSGVPTLEEVKNSVVPAEILGDVLGSKQAVLGQKASDARAQAITRGTYGYPESAYITAGGSVGLTTQSGAPAIINYVNGTVATDEDFTTFTTGTFGANSATNQNYIKNALVSLELLKDVYGELNTKIANNALPTGTTGTVVTYNGTNAQTGVQEFTETAIYSGPTAQNPYNATNDAGKLATAGFVESTKQDKIPVQTMTIGTGNTAFTAPLSLVSYPTTTDGVVGQLAVFDESAFNNYVRANNIDTNNMGLSDGVNLVSNIMMEVMPNSVPTSYMVVGLLDLFGQGIGESYNIKIPASGQYDLSGNNPYTDGNGTTNTDWLNAGVKGTGVATRTGANGVIGERKIFEATDFANYHTTGLTQNQKDIQDISIPTMGAVMTAINAHTPATLSWTATETTATGGYSTAFDDTTGNWPAADANKLIDGTALANGLVLKQNKIPTGLVVFEDGDVQGGNDLTVRALVATNASGTEVLGNTIGIVDANTIANSNEAGLALYGDSENYGSEMDNFVPTVRAVANALTDIWSNMPWWTALSWSINVNGASDNGVNRTAAINAYNTTFGSGTNNWAGTSTHLIDGQFLANSLALKQNKIPATDDDYYSVLTDGDTDGEVGKLRVLTAEYMENNGESFASWVPNDNEIVTAGAIHRELLNNWQPIIPASMASNVIAHQTLSLPSFVVANVLTNGASPTLSSGTYGIITQDNIEDYAGLWSEFALLSNMDSAIPTVKAVANAITRLEWNSRIENTINAYRTQFFASGSDVWWFSEYDKLINTSVFSKGLALKQNKLVAKASNARAQAVTRSTAGDTSSAYITAGGSVGLTTRSGAPAIINYVNGTVATDEDFTTFTNSTFGTATGDALTTNKNYIKNALVSLELLKDVYSALHNEIQNATPTGTLGNVAMYDANTGALGNGQPVASAAIYTTDNNVTTLSNGNSIANIAAVETKQAKIPTTSNGTNNTPNYVYDATTNSTADGSVVTTTGTAGTVSQRGIATAAVPNGSGGYTNGDWIPTVGAMMAAITNQVTSATETLSWTATETTATQNYSTTFNGTTNNWPAADEDKLVDGAALANGLAQKQNKMTCAGYETGHENDINYCWLWRIAD